ncbi:hypothetical protein SLEP1_g35857 [Rubroshorea leprosula]|uniref:Uncharacterized protein n=1 Tax=Rubroshorea leprosula TaxID=152421 RepID=A0AAV5KPN1_9ROSI|nr:hypothetical protein SLEP1_g35857 [Rubroshorea leprosula]
MVLLKPKGEPTHDASSDDSRRTFGPLNCTTEISHNLDWAASNFTGCSESYITADDSYSY